MESISPCAKKNHCDVCCAAYPHAWPRQSEAPTNHIKPTMVSGQQCQPEPGPEQLNHSTMKDLEFEGCKFIALPPDEERREMKKKKRSSSIKLVLAIAGLALVAGCVAFISQRRGESLSLFVAILST